MSICRLPFLCILIVSSVNSLGFNAFSATSPSDPWVLSPAEIKETLSGYETKDSEPAVKKPQKASVLKNIFKNSQTPAPKIVAPVSTKKIETTPKPQSQSPLQAPAQPLPAPGPMRSTEAEERVHDDLTALAQFNFVNVSPLFVKTFGGSDAASVVKFFTDRVHHIVTKNEGHGVTASVDPSTDVMRIGSELMNDDPSKGGMPQIIRLSTYIHEARHTEVENQGWPHRFCPRPYYFKLTDSISFRMTHLESATVGKCDDSSDGAYGVEYIFLRAIVNSCVNCSPKMKLQAKLYSDYQTLTRITNVDAVIHLVNWSNPDFKDAVRETNHVLADKLRSGLLFPEWFKRCENNDGTCLSSPVPHGVD